MAECGCDADVPVVIAERVCAAYGRTQVLADLSCSIRQNSLFALIGRNGAGKSTFIRAIMGLHAISSGDLRVFGQPVHRDRKYCRDNIGYVPEHVVLYEWMRVQQLVDFVASFYPRWDNLRARMLLKEFSIPEAKKVQALSIGTRTKLAMVLALASGSRLLVLDEPLAHVDVIDKAKAYSMLEEFMQFPNHSVIFSSHLVDDAVELSDSIGIMHDGALILTLQAINNDSISDTYPSKLVNVVQIPIRGIKGIRKFNIANCYSPIIANSLGIERRGRSLLMAEVTLGEFFGRIVQLVSKG